MVRAVERDHLRASGEVARGLDRPVDGVPAGEPEGDALRNPPGRERRKTLGEDDHRLVVDVRGVVVEQALGLVADGLDDPRMLQAHVQRRGAGEEIDPLAPIRPADDGSPAALDDERIEGEPRRARDHGRVPRDDGIRGRRGHRAAVAAASASHSAVTRSTGHLVSALR